MPTDDQARCQSALLAMLFAALGMWLLIWSGSTLWAEGLALYQSARLVELHAGAASGFVVGVGLLALTVGLTVGQRSARWQRRGVGLAIGTVPLVLILPAVMLFGGGGYLAARGYVDCPNAVVGQRFPVVRKVQPQARALCTADSRTGQSSLP